MDVTNLADLYNLAPMDWEPIRARLDAGLSQVPGSGGPSRHTCWLSTINADGSPHVVAIAPLWVDGAFWFECGDRSRKARNLARDPRCSLSMATEEFDLSVAGTASRVTDPAAVAKLVEIWRGDWPVSVDDTGIGLTAEFSAPSAGPPPWYIHRIELRTATAVATVAPGGATRWRF